MLICPPFFQIFRVVCICLGNPPETFTWEYRDKDKNYQKIGPVTPLKFYRQHVKPLFNMEDKVRDWQWQPLAFYFQMPVDYKKEYPVPGLICMVIQQDTKPNFSSSEVFYIPVQLATQDSQHSSSKTFLTVGPQSV